MDSDAKERKQKTTNANHPAPKGPVPKLSRFQPTKNECVIPKEKTDGDAKERKQDATNASQPAP